MQEGGKGEKGGGGDGDETGREGRKEGDERKSWRVKKEEGGGPGRVLVIGRKLETQLCRAERNLS